MKTVRVYARMDLGGVENAVLQYLEAQPDDTMVVTHAEGLRAPQARALCPDYRFVGDRPRLPALVEAMQGAHVVHVHAINHDPLPFLAAQLAGVPVVLQTLHNHFTPRTELLAEHTVCVGLPLLGLLAEPGHATFIPNGVVAPEALPRFRPVDRPLRILELRRADKEMQPSLEDIANSGVFAPGEVEMRVAGFTREHAPPGLTWLGALSDPTEQLAWADLVLHASRFDTFGRVVYEALAWGSVPVTVPNPVFRDVFSDDEAYFLRSTNPGHAALEIRALAQRLRDDPQTHARHREAAHGRVLRDFTPQAMVRRTRELTAGLLAAGPRARTVAAGEIDDLERYGTEIDALLYGRPLDLAPLSRLRGTEAGLAVLMLVMLGRVPNPKAQVDLLTQAHRLLGDRPALVWSLARAQLAAGQDALPMLLRSLQLRPGLVPGWMDALRLTLERGQHSAARQLAEQALVHHPDQPELARLARRVLGQPSPRIWAAR